MESYDFRGLFLRAQEARRDLVSRLHEERTDAYRLFHGVAEGAPGFTLDRYGSLLLAQTFRAPLEVAQRDELEGVLKDLYGADFDFAYNHRGKSAREAFDLWHHPSESALRERVCEEFGVKYHIRARHPGIDPWLFLDLRSGRRFLRERVRDRSVLNLFSYTCSVGLSLAQAGAKEVLNIDFASSSLEVGRRNALLNEVSEETFATLEEDCIPAMRQLAGLPVGGRKSQPRKYKKLEARVFDVVILDPPAWAKSPFGAIDVAGDYQSLFKAALLCTRPNGGIILCTNHVASVDRQVWLDSLRRCADKAGRPLRNVETLTPEADFPSFDGNSPLKIAVCDV